MVKGKMSSSIYNISTWSNSTDYKQHDIVFDGSFYYYALVDHTSHPSQSFSQTRNDNPSLWGGVGTDPNTGETKAQFIWTPSYSYPINITPKVKNIVFGDGYEQRVRDGLNTILLEIDIKFDERTQAEATAILHFFYEKAGYKSFLYLPAPPYNTTKKFVARSWNHVNNFFNNYSINAKFEEVSN